MLKYEKIYAFDVVDKVKNGKNVYLIDKAKCNDENAIRWVNEMQMQEVMPIIARSDEDNRFEFFEVRLLEG